MATLNELRDLRGTAVAEARKIKDTADAAGRPLSAEERASFNLFMDDSIKYKAQIDDEVRLQDTERELATVAIALLTHAAKVQILVTSFGTPPSAK